MIGLSQPRQELQWVAVIEPQQDQKPRVALTMRIGIISDTHGLLRPEVTELTRGCPLRHSCWRYWPP